MLAFLWLVFGERNDVRRGHERGRKRHRIRHGVGGAAARLAGQLVLIVEDNLFVAHQVVTVLTDAGCENCEYRAGVAFVDGVVTEFQDLGAMLDEASFQGR
jgi:hypothetical protein